jgi:hypothetical protein
MKVSSVKAVVIRCQHVNVHLADEDDVEGERRLALVRGNLAVLVEGKQRGGGEREREREREAYLVHDNLALTVGVQRH